MEILVVAAIIAVLAAISLPGILRSRIRANESSAISNMHSLATATQSYWTINMNAVAPATPLPANWDNLQAPVDGTSFIILGNDSNNDGVIEKGGYNYQFGAGNDGSADNFWMLALPQMVDISGSRNFCFTEDGVIRQTDAGDTANPVTIADKTACQDAAAVE